VTWDNLFDNMQAALCPTTIKGCLDLARQEGCEDPLSLRLCPGDLRWAQDLDPSLVGPHGSPLRLSEDQGGALRLCSGPATPKGAQGEAALVSARTGEVVVRIVRLARRCPACGEASCYHCPECARNVLAGHAESCSFDPATGLLAPPEPGEAPHYGVPKWVRALHQVKAQGVVSPARPGEAPSVPPGPLEPSRPDLDRSGHREWLTCPECESQVVCGDPSCRTHPEGGCEDEPKRCEGWYVFWEGTRESCPSCGREFWVEVEDDVASLAALPDEGDLV